MQWNIVFKNTISEGFMQWNIGFKKNDFKEIHLWIRRLDCIRVYSI